MTLPSLARGQAQGLSKHPVNNGLAAAMGVVEAFHPIDYGSAAPAVEGTGAGKSSSCQSATAIGVPFRIRTGIALAAGVFACLS